MGHAVENLLKRPSFPFVCYKQVIANQEAVDIARKIKDPQKAAKQLIAEALKRDSKDDISCIVVRFRG
jgi:protein phosphatase 1L